MPPSPFGFTPQTPSGSFLQTTQRRGRAQSLIEQIIQALAQGQGFGGGGQPTPGQGLPPVPGGPTPPLPPLINPSGSLSDRIGQRQALRTFGQPPDPTAWEIDGKTGEPVKPNPELKSAKREKTFSTVFDALGALGTALDRRRARKDAQNRFAQGFSGATPGMPEPYQPFFMPQFEARQAQADQQATQMAQLELQRMQADRAKRLKQAENDQKATVDIWKSLIGAAGPQAFKPSPGDELTSKYEALRQIVGDEEAQRIVAGNPSDKQYAPGLWSALAKPSEQRTDAEGRYIEALIRDKNTPGGGGSSIPSVSSAAATIARNLTDWGVPYEEANKIGLQFARQLLEVYGGQNPGQQPQGPGWQQDSPGTIRSRAQAMLDAKERNPTFYQQNLAKFTEWYGASPEEVLQYAQQMQGGVQ